MHLNEPFGHHEGGFARCLTQIANDHAPAAAGSMDHLTVSQVKSHMFDMATPVAKKEEVSRQHYRKSQGAGHYRTYPGLLAAGARQVYI